MSAKDWMKNKLDGATSNKTYRGAVEDNKDPKRLGRCKIRVFDIFDEKNKEGKYIFQPIITKILSIKTFV